MISQLTFADALLVIALWVISTRDQSLEGGVGEANLDAENQDNFCNAT